MKKSAKIICLFLLAALLFSCKQLANFENSQNKASDDSILSADNENDFVKINLSISNDSRMTLVPETQKYITYTYTLTGYYNGSKELLPIKTFDNYNNLIESFEIKKGKWELILTACKKDYDNAKEGGWLLIPILQDSISKEITKDETQNFTLKEIENSGIAGSYEIILNYPKSEYWDISASIKELASINNQKNDKIIPLELSEIKKGDDYAIISGNLPAGQYKINLELTKNTAASKIFTTIPVFLTIASDCNTSGELFIDSKQLNIICPINYADFSQEKESPYTLPEDFPKEYTSYKSYALPKAERENYDFAGWYTDENFSAESKITKTPLATFENAGELKLYPKFRTQSSPYFSLEDSDGIKINFKDEFKKLFEDEENSQKMTSVQIYVKNTETGFEWSPWFNYEEFKAYNFDYSNPFVNAGTEYEVRLLLSFESGSKESESLAITPSKGLGEDKATYKNAEFELGKDGILHITSIPAYNTKYDQSRYLTIQIWSGKDWSNCNWIGEKEYNYSEIESNSLDIDLTPYLDRGKLYGKDFMILAGGYYKYNNKKYAFEFGNPNFIFGDAEHYYGPEPIQKEIILECKATYENHLYLKNPIGKNSGYTDLYVEWYAESEAASFAGFHLINADDQYKIASSFASQDSSEFDSYLISWASCFAGSTYDAYDEEGSHKEECSDGATYLEVFFADSNWQPSVEGTVYIKRIWLSGQGKEDLPIEILIE